MNVSNFEAQSAYDAVAVTPSDTVAPVPTTKPGFSPKPFGIYVGGTGDLVLVLESGATATWKAVPVGTTIYARFTLVKAATSATNLLALYQGV